MTGPLKFEQRPGHWKEQAGSSGDERDFTGFIRFTDTLSFSLVAQYITSTSPLDSEVAQAHVTVFFGLTAANPRLQIEEPHYHLLPSQCCLRNIRMCSFDQSVACHNTLMKTPFFHCQAKFMKVAKELPKLVELAVWPLKWRWFNSDRKESIVWRQNKLF